LTRVLHGAAVTRGPECGKLKNIHCVKAVSRKRLMETVIDREIQNILQFGVLGISNVFYEILHLSMLGMFVYFRLSCILNIINEQYRLLYTA
jgi:hypothetical protein